MSAPATTTEFLAVLRKSGLVDEARFAELFPDESDLPADPASCAAGLVNRALLTRYQAVMLLAGKTESGEEVSGNVVRDPLPSPTRRSNRKRRETAAAQREKWYRLVWSIGAVALVGVIALVAGLSDKGTASARPAGPVATGPAQPDRP